MRTLMLAALALAGCATRYPTYSAAELDAMPTPQLRAEAYHSCRVADQPKACGCLLESLERDRVDEPTLRSMLLTVAIGRDVAPAKLPVSYPRSDTPEMMARMRACGVS